MSLSRRDFLKYGATTAGTVVATQGIDLAPVEAAATSIRIKEAKVYPGVCPYCAVGCAQLIYVKDNKIIDIEGTRTPRIPRAPSVPRARPRTSFR